MSFLLIEQRSGNLVDEFDSLTEALEFAEEEVANNGSLATWGLFRGRPNRTTLVLDGAELAELIDFALALAQEPVLP